MLDTTVSTTLTVLRSRPVCCHLATSKAYFRSTRNPWQLLHPLKAPPISSHLASNDAVLHSLVCRKKNNYNYNSHRLLQKVMAALRVVGELPDNLSASPSKPRFEEMWNISWCCCKKDPEDLKIVSMGCRLESRIPRLLLLIGPYGR